MAYCHPSSHSASRTGQMSGNTFSGLALMVWRYVLVVRRAVNAVDLEESIESPPASNTTLNPKFVNRHDAKNSKSIRTQLTTTRMPAIV